MSKSKLSGVIKSKNMKSSTSNHWSQGLISAMDDPDLIVDKTDKTVTIRDKYPKAKHHYLILPKENITNLAKLNRTHLPLLNEMMELAYELEKKHNINCKIGYHSVPSMQRLHLHVISDDFVSPSLKTKTHWNSYNTKFFIPSKELINEIEEKGCVTEISKAIHEEFIKTPLKCHKCDYIPKNMPTLKTHLLSHVS